MTSTPDVQRVLSSLIQRRDYWQESVDEQRRASLDPSTESVDDDAVYQIKFDQNFAFAYSYAISALLDILDQSGDENAVQTLISLLDSERKTIREEPSDGGYSNQDRAGYNAYTDIIHFLTTDSYSFH